MRMGTILTLLAVAITDSSEILLKCYRTEMLIDMLPNDAKQNVLVPEL